VWFKLLPGGYEMLMMDFGEIQSFISTVESGDLSNHRESHGKYSTSG
jgi:hypothetical protein